MELAARAGSRSRDLHLGAGDLAMLGVFLYGARWQTALAREIGVDPRLVRRWAAGERPISKRFARAIVELVRARHERRLASLRQTYAVMIDVLACKEARTILSASAEATNRERQPPN